MEVWVIELLRYFYKFVNIFLLIGGAVSVVVYGLFITTLIKRRENGLNSPYFTMCISLGVADISKEVFNFLSLKLPDYGYLASFYLGGGRDLSRILRFMDWCPKWAQIIGVTCLSLNRCMAIVWPLSYQQVWVAKKWTAPACVVFQWVVSVVISLPILTHNTTYVRIGNDTAIHLLLSAESIGYFKLVSIVYVVVAIFLSVAYILMMLKLRKHTRKIGDAANKDNSLQKSEIRLSIGTFFIFLTLVGVAVTHALYGFSTQWTLLGFFFTYLCLLFFSEAFSWCNPYILLLTAPVVRKNFLEMIGKSQTTTSKLFNQIYSQLTKETLNTNQLQL